MSMYSTDCQTYGIVKFLNIWLKSYYEGIRNCLCVYGGMGRLSRYSYSLRAGRSAIECRWGAKYPHPSKPALGLTQPSVQQVMGLVPGGKTAGPWR